MSNKQWYIISDLKSFVNSTRSLVYNGFGKGLAESPDDFSDMIDQISDPNFMKELDEFLSYRESLLLVKESVKKQINSKTGKKRYLINDDSFFHILETLNARLVANILSGLVKKGLVETAFDNEENDFIFWVKDETKQSIKDSIEKPETD